MKPRLLIFSILAAAAIAAQTADPFAAEVSSGNAADLNGDYAEARRRFAKAIDLAKPDQKARALRSMAISYAFEGKGNEAAKFEKPVYDDQIAAGNFTAAAETANEQARLSLESGDLDDAYSWYRLGHENGLKKTGLTDAERDLWDFRWEHAQARIDARRGKADSANRHVAAAKAILAKGSNPDQARFFPYLTGYVAFYAKDYAQSLIELQKADQRDPFILSLIAQAYEKTGSQEKAMEYYRKVMESKIHNPTNAFARPLARAKLKL